MRIIFRLALPLVHCEQYTAKPLRFEELCSQFEMSFSESSERNNSILLHIYLEFLIMEALGNPVVPEV